MQVQFCMKIVALNSDFAAKYLGAGLSSAPALITPSDFFGWAACVSAHIILVCHIVSVFASVGSSHLCSAGPALEISTFSLNNHFVGDYIQICWHNHLFYFGISK